VEGDRSAAEPKDDDARDPELGQPAQRSALELPPGRTGEAGAVRPAVPADLVQLERLLEGRFQLAWLTRDLCLESPGSRELLALARVLVAALRRRLGAVDVFPAAVELEHGRF
jgi:hypothetical protein